MRFLNRLFDSTMYWFDFMVGYVMTHPHKLPYYHRYMYQKYGERYCSKEVFERYWRLITMNDHLNED